MKVLEQKIGADSVVPVKSNLILGADFRAFFFYDFGGVYSMLKYSVEVEFGDDMVDLQQIIDIACANYVHRALVNGAPSMLPYRQEGSAGKEAV